MANWIPIVEADLDDAKLAKLVTALRTKALREDPPQTDPTPRITQTVIDRIRRKIANNVNNSLDSDTTKIPKSLKGMAVGFILAEMKGRLEIGLTTEETRAIERYESDLKAIAAGEAVEDPDDPIAAPVQKAAGSPTITDCRRERRLRRNGQ